MRNRDNLVTSKMGRFRELTLPKHLLSGDKRVVKAAQSCVGVAIFVYCLIKRDIGSLVNFPAQLFASLEFLLSLTIAYSRFECPEFCLILLF